MSLKHLLEQRLTHTLQHKGLCKLLGLDYTVQYKGGSQNLAADALSRRESHKGVEVLSALSEIIPSWIEELKKSYENDSWAQQVIQ